MAVVKREAKLQRRPGQVLNPSRRHTHKQGAITVGGRGERRDGERDTGDHAKSTQKGTELGSIAPAAAPMHQSENAKIEAW